MIEDAFLKFSHHKLLQFRDRIVDCLSRLNYEQVWARSSDNTNSIGNLVLHLCGNVRQWIGTGVAGKPDQRDRDAEFAARGGIQPEELAKRLNEIAEEAAAIILNLPHERLADTRQIQNYDVNVMEAIYHVVEHFGQHTAQIIFATKLVTSEDLGYYRHLNKPKHLETTP